jgi:hypothetical protein
MWGRGGHITVSYIINVLLFAYICREQLVSGSEIVVTRGMNVGAAGT